MSSLRSLRVSAFALSPQVLLSVAHLAGLSIISVDIATDGQDVKEFVVPFYPIESKSAFQALRTLTLQSEVRCIPTLFANGFAFQMLNDLTIDMTGVNSTFDVKKCLEALSMSCLQLQRLTLTRRQLYDDVTSTVEDYECAGDAVLIFEPITRMLNLEYFEFVHFLAVDMNHCVKASCRKKHD